ncbi:hypothetical protein [Ruegeria sp. Alg231-54]|uniref:hypothetical protein n=1 Tax=Ruegeria sp. Alg231-54 TaxID=1922221 RepID=UPI000D550B08|nr:hypothetical protein [Ruegeria sp. Alg231-54]
MHRFEGFMVFIGIVGPFATLPQLIKLYFTHSQHATGQSLLSFLWFAYGLVVGKLTIYVGNGISMVLNILIHAGLTF